MTDERRIQIEQTVADLEAQGRTSWTYEEVYHIVRGNFPEVANYLRERRATQRAGSPAERPQLVSASVATLEPPAALADPERSERLARKRAQWRALQAAAATAPVPPVTRPRVIQTAIIPGAFPAVVTMGLDVAADEPPRAVEPAPEVPKLEQARQEVLRWQESRSAASRREKPIADKIAAFTARQAQLAKARAKVETLPELQAIKAEQVEVEEHLEILTRKHRPLTDTAKSLSAAELKVQRDYEYVRETAVRLLGRCRAHHFSSNDAKQQASLLADLTALIGPEAVEKYVTSLTEPYQTRDPRCNPPWFPQNGIK